MCCCLLSWNSLSKGRLAINAALWCPCFVMQLKLPCLAAAAAVCCLLPHHHHHFMGLAWLERKGMCREKLFSQTSLIGWRFFCPKRMFTQWLWTELSLGKNETKRVIIIPCVSLIYLLTPPNYWNQSDYESSVCILAPASLISKLYFVCLRELTDGDSP